MPRLVLSMRSVDDGNTEDSVGTAYMCLVISHVCQRDAGAIEVCIGHPLNARWRAFQRGLVDVDYVFKFIGITRLTNP